MHIGNVRPVRKLCHACLAPKTMFTLKYVYIKICHALLLHWLCTRKHEQKTHSALRRSLCTRTHGPNNHSNSSMIPLFIAACKASKVYHRSKQIRTRVRAHTHVHTRARTRARTGTRTRARTHTCIHTC